MLAHLSGRRAALLPLGLRAALGAYRTSPDLVSHDSVVMVAFGFRRGLSGEVRAGDSNLSLASFVKTILNDEPVVVQHEFVGAFRQVGLPTPSHVITDARDGGYLDTHEFLQQAKAALRGLGKARPLIVAHPHHMPRVAAVAQSLKLDCRYPSGIPSVWDRKSEQAWTRGPIRWVPREIYALALYRKRGYL